MSKNHQSTWLVHLSGPDGGYGARLNRQLKGIPTKKRYNSATLFVDHFSGTKYVYLQQALTSKETVQTRTSVKA